MAHPYVYKELNGDVIRVLVIEPAAEMDDPLRCTLEHVKEEDFWDGVVPKSPDPPYDALSYVWGLSKNLPRSANYVSIDCKGTILEVTHNSDSALRHLRRPDVPVRMWVDAVCINQNNQNNQEEMKQQLMGMGYIYQFAQNVVIWLGKGLGDVKGLFDWMRTAGPVLRADENSVNDHDLLNAAGKKMVDDARDQFGRSKLSSFSYRVPEANTPTYPEIHYELFLYLMRH